MSLHATHGFDLLQTLTDHYGPHNIVNAEASQVELKTFNSVVASNAELRRMTTRGVMTHLLKGEELKSLTKLAAIGLLLLLSTVDCERGFSTLSRVKTDLRNRLCNRTLNNLLIISIEGPDTEDYPYDKACNLWASWRNRRIQVES